MSNSPEITLPIQSGDSTATGLTNHPVAGGRNLGPPYLGTEAEIEYLGNY